MVHGALSAAKYAGNPTQVRLRRALALDPDVTSAALRSVDAQSGFSRFVGDDVPGVDAVVARCRTLAAERREALNTESFVVNRNKVFLLSVLAGDEFCEYPDLLSFMVSRRFLDTATRYLGAVPLLTGANLWWTPPNDSAKASQLFHTDNEDWRQLKVFINLFDTSDESGPLTFLPADVSSVAGRLNRYVTGRLSDEQVFASASPADLIRLVGATGSGAFVDTSRCMHFGSRGNTADRLMLTFQFMRFDSPSESTSPLTVRPSAVPTGLDRIQQLALGVE